jgi:hypothetical protein
MIGLQLPRIFYGQIQRQQVIGQRADFCEFCVCVCRHDIVSFQAASAVFFYPLKYEEFKRESRCEICQMQFPIAFQERLAKSAGDFPIADLVKTTNPEIVGRAILETKQMIDWPGGAKLIARNRVVNFLRGHELEYHWWMKRRLPLFAVGSIQFLIIGFILSLFLPAELAVMIVCCGCFLAALLFFKFLKTGVQRCFGNRITRLLGLTGKSLDELDSEITDLKKRFPRSALIFLRQIEVLKRSPIASFSRERDFVPTLELTISASDGFQAEVLGIPSLSASEESERR